MSESNVLPTISGPYVRTPVSSLATFLAAQLPGSIPVATITASLSAYIQTNPPAPLPLTAINPDFESNKAEMSNVLATTNTWADTITAGVGQTLAEMIATAATLNQLSIEKAVQESIIDTAVLDSSIYGITRMLGVKIQRRNPANVPVTIYNPISQTTTFEALPYTQFQVGGINYFNRTAIVIPPANNWTASTNYALGATVFPTVANGYSYICTSAGESGTTQPTWPLTAGVTVTDNGAVWEINTANTASVPATLYEGQLNSVSFTSNGQPYQIFEFGNSDFTISNSDVNVTVNGIAYSPTTNAQNFNIGLWEFSSNSLVFEETTNAVGNVEIKFGNGTYGIIPPNGATIVVQFASTNGQEGNANLTSQSVTASTYSTLSGVATGVTSQGSDQLSAYDYKNLGPGTFAAKYRAVIPADHNAIALTYPGVIDALFLGQAIFAPGNLEYMMAVQAVLLTTTVWTSPQFAAFNTFMQNLACTNEYFIQVVPTPVVLNLVINLYCFPQANLTTVENQVIANLQAAFTPGVGSLGYSWFDSDYKRIITNTSQLIDYFDIISPTVDDFPANNYQYVTLGSVIINTAFSTRVLKGN